MIHTSAHQCEKRQHLPKRIRSTRTRLRFPFSVTRVKRSSKLLHLLKTLRYRRDLLSWSSPLVDNVFGRVLSLASNLLAGTGPGKVLKPLSRCLLQTAHGREVPLVNYLRLRARVGERYTTLQQHKVLALNVLAHCPGQPQFQRYAEREQTVTK